MKYVDLSLTEYTEKLGSGDSTPGGGGAAALAGAQGIALTKMVAEFTVGKKKYAEFEEEVQELNAQYGDLMYKFLAGVDADKDAFSGMEAVFSMPNKSDEEKAARREAMQVALGEAVKPPLNIMELSVEGLKATEAAIGKTNTNVASDIACGAINLKAALEAGWVNILVNTTGMKDKDLAADLEAKGQAYLEEGRVIADRIVDKIMEQIS